MQNINFKNVTITCGFWKEKQNLNKNVTAKSAYERFKETHRFKALECSWKEGDTYCPHIFWDSDVAKWMEGIFYIAQKENIPELLALAEEAVYHIIKNADSEGYFNSHYLVTNKENRFTRRGDHELYCAGHLIEAAIAYFETTGKDYFLKAMCRFADYIEKIFLKDKSAAFVTPGHQEIELALVKLYKVTGEKRYLELAKFFVEKRSNNDLDKNHNREDEVPVFDQSNLPARELNEVNGHCVRAMYYYSAMADLAREYGDNELKSACERLFDNTVNQKMYITGGLDSTYDLECFTIGYNLPNEGACAETCAAIAFAMFSRRMQELNVDSRYADMVEKVIYNGMLSGLSMDGKAFFYENPLEIDLKFRNRNPNRPWDEHHPITQRVEIFECSCCPPNIVRFLASIGDYIYSVDDDMVYIHQYIENTAEIDGKTINIATEYPKNGAVKITCPTGTKLAIRIPGWCIKFKINHDYELKNGYAHLTANGEVNMEFDMPVQIMSANRKVYANADRVAVMRGPVVYCAEGVDNGDDVKTVIINPKGDFTLGDGEFGLPNIYTAGYRPVNTELLYAPVTDQYEVLNLKLIPYHAFANRGESEMQVLLLKM